MKTGSPSDSRQRICKPLPNAPRETSEERPEGEPRPSVQARRKRVPYSTARRSQASKRRRPSRIASNLGACAQILLRGLLPAWRQNSVSNLPQTPYPDFPNRIVQLRFLHQSKRSVASSPILPNFGSLLASNTILKISSHCLRSIVRTLCSNSSARSLPARPSSCMPPSRSSSNRQSTPSLPSSRHTKAFASTRSNPVMQIRTPELSPPQRCVCNARTSSRFPAPIVLSKVESSRGGIQIPAEISCKKPASSNQSAELPSPGTRICFSAAFKNNRVFW